MSTTRLSLAQQIAQLEETAPADFDPEDIQITGADPEEEGEVDDSGARAHYLDVGPSALRKIHDSVADPKYDGKRTTRRQLLESEEASDAEEHDASSEEEAGLSAESQSMDEDESEKNEDEDNSGELEEAVTEARSMQPEPVDDLSSTLRKTRDEDRTKGKAISRQLAIWDTLLDARIRMQKSVTAANQLPAPSNILRFTASDEGCTAVNRLLDEAMSLSDDLFEFQESLLTSNESIQPPPRKRRRTETSETDSLSDYSPRINEASHAASALNHSMHPHLVQTLSKWSSKIQAVAPSVLLPSNRGAFSNKSAPGLKSALQLVDETLQAAEYEKILTRTRIKRGKGARVGREVADNEEKEDVDIEIFDDTDFYQQLLRDVIDARGNGNALGGADDWMVIQKQKKATKKVDTKASKGRKLRYEVHEKLQNFMVPVPVQGSWHDEQVDELFASLLGKGFESAGGDYGVDADAGQRDVEAEKKLEVELGEALKGGFRVFG